MKIVNNKVALVTGASKGIGAEIAKSLAQNGAQVIVNYNTDSLGAKSVINDIEKQGGTAIAIKGDLIKSDDVVSLFKNIKETYGKLDILINNAGVYQFEPVETITEQEFRRHFDTNVLSIFLTIQEALKHFNEHGGSIINISSVASVKATPMTSLYTATKSAVDGITRSLSKELGARNIRVNSILPGPTPTEGNQMNDDIKNFVTANTPLGKIGTSSDIAKLAAFLASDDAAWITGQKITISGGFD